MDQPETPPAPTPETALPTASPVDPDKADIEQNKDIAAFGYIWIMSVVVFFLRRNSPFVRFHAKQAMILFLLTIIVAFIPYLNRFLEFGIFALMVYGFINAAQGLRKDVPIVGPLSRGEITIRQAWKLVVEAVVHGVQVLKSLFRTKEPPTSPSQSPPDSAPSSSPTESSPPPVSHP